MSETTPPTPGSPPPYPATPGAGAPPLPPGYAPPPPGFAAQTLAPYAQAPSYNFNVVFEVKYRRGWPGLFSGENQTKALSRALADVNGQGLGVAAAVADKWSFWQRLVWTVVAVVTLGFVVRGPNILLITHRVR